MHHLPRRAFVLASLVILPAAVLLAQSAPKPGNPEDHLPPNISHLTWFGERASWSPDGRRIAFMSKSFGDAFEIDAATRVIRLLTHYPHAGFLRVQYLPNGDYFLIGARDVRRHRHDARSRPGDVGAAARLQAGRSRAPSGP